MKNLFIILILASLTTVGYAQDPKITGDDYKIPPQCSPDKRDPNLTKDMNYTMDMNNPINMNNGTLGDSFDWHSDFIKTDSMNVQTSKNQDMCRYHENNVRHRSN